MHRLQAIWFPPAGRGPERGGRRARRAGPTRGPRRSGAVHRRVLAAPRRLPARPGRPGRRSRASPRSSAQAASPIQALEWGTFLATREGVGRSLRRGARDLLDDGRPLPSHPPVRRRCRAVRGDAPGLRRRRAGSTSSWSCSNGWTRAPTPCRSPRCSGFVFSEFGRSTRPGPSSGRWGRCPTVPFDWLWLSTTYTVGRPCASRSTTPRRPQLLYPALLPYAGQVSMAGSMPISGCIDLVLGGMARLLGDDDGRGPPPRRRDRDRDAHGRPGVARPRARGEGTPHRRRGGPRRAVGSPPSSAACRCSVASGRPELPPGRYLRRAPASTGSVTPVT